MGKVLDVILDIALYGMYVLLGVMIFGLAWLLFYLSDSDCAILYYGFRIMSVVWILVDLIYLIYCVYNCIKKD